VSLVVLSLFDHSGNWSRPYEEAGYQVRRFDLQDGHDVRLIKSGDMGPVHGILAAPPCTKFSRAGARWWDRVTDEEMLEAISTVDAVFRIVYATKPHFWVLENPIGRLKDYIGEPAFKFDPCDFGDPWTKRTWLWGNFAPPIEILAPCGPVEPALGDITTNARKGMNERSQTPMGFARAFFEANP
jgi:hypothetical protein